MQIKNTVELEKEKISKVLLKLSVPAATGLFVMVLYNIVDTIFIGQGVGSLGIAGLAIVMPIQMLIGTMGQAIGIGGASIISRSLGEGNFDKVNRTFGNLIGLVILLSLVFVPTSYFYMDYVLYLFGAQSNILPFAKDYFVIVLLGTPFLSFLMMSNNVIRAEGNAKTPMYSMILSALLNTILDPIFIFTLDMGIKGAALATVISQFFAFVFVLWFYFSGQSIMKVKLKDFFLEASIVKEVFSLGASTLARQGAQSILSAILNHSLFVYGGELSVAVWGVLDRIIRLTIFPIIGLIQGSLVIIGFNYGAKKFRRVYDTLKISNNWAIIILIIGFLIIMVFAKTIISVFSNDPVLIEKGTHAARLVFMLMPLWGFQMIGASYFQAIGKALPAFVLTLSRQMLFLIPLVLVMPMFFGLDGLWYSFAISDLVSAVVTIIFLLPEIKLLRSKR